MVGKISYQISLLLIDSCLCKLQNIFPLSIYYFNVQVVDTEVHVSVFTF